MVNGVGLILNEQVQAAQAPLSSLCIKIYKCESRKGGRPETRTQSKWEVKNDLNFKIL